MSLTTWLHDRQQQKIIWTYVNRSKSIGFIENEISNLFYFKHTCNSKQIPVWHKQSIMQNKPDTILCVIIFYIYNSIFMKDISYFIHTTTTWMDLSLLIAVTWTDNSNFFLLIYIRFYVEQVWELYDGNEPFSHVIWNSSQGNDSWLCVNFRSNCSMELWIHGIFI